MRLARVTTPNLVWLAIAAFVVFGPLMGGSEGSLGKPRFDVGQPRAKVVLPPRF